KSRSRGARLQLPRLAVPHGPAAVSERLISESPLVVGPPDHRIVSPSGWRSMGTGHNPRLMLGWISQKRLVELESDEAFLAQMDRARANLNEYLWNTGWFCRAHPDATGLTVAYFSAEFGLTECVPNYAGGL